MNYTIQYKSENPYDFKIEKAREDKTIQTTLYN